MRRRNSVCSVLLLLLSSSLELGAQAATPQAVSLARYQTPVRDQAQRGTCWAFGTTAAIEAAYKRKYGLELDLSEQYVFHMGKAGELFPNYLDDPRPYENNSSNWGFQGGSDMLTKMPMIAVPEERYAPYLNDRKMEELRLSLPEVGDLATDVTQEKLDAFEFSERHIPTEARYHAVYRVTRWARAGRSIDRVESVLASGHELVADFDMSWRWNAARNAYDAGGKSRGGHVMLIVGYDRREGIFLLKNSWGGRSLTCVTYEFMRSGLLASHYIVDVADPSAAPQADAMMLGNWRFADARGEGRLLIRRNFDFHKGAGVSSKLGNLYRDGQSYDVNGFFSADGRVLTMAISREPGRVALGTMGGDVFLVRVDPSRPGVVRATDERGQPIAISRF